MNFSKKSLNLILILISVLILGVVILFPHFFEVQIQTVKANSNLFKSESPESMQQGEYTDILIDIDTTHQISLFLANDGHYYLLLPSYIPEIQVNNLTLQATELLSKRSPSLSSDSLIVLQSKNLSTIMIDFYEGDIDQLNSDKKVTAKALMEIYTVDGDLEYSDIIDIHGHGFSSFYETHDKSYKVITEHTGSILGMPNANDWVLVSNAFDSTHVRNKVIYDSVNDLFNILSVNSEFADVYINGNYEGSYLVCEDIDSESVWQNKIGDTLININRSEEEDSTFTTKTDTTYIVEYPAKISNKYQDELCSKMNEIESLIDSCSSEEDLNNLNELIDINSLVEMFIINFITQESDANTNSTYYYLSDDGRLYAGPIWDYDRALGSEIRGTYVQINSYINGFPEKLFENNDLFRTLVSQRLSEINANCLGSSLAKELLRYIERYSEQIYSSLIMDRVVNGLSGTYSIDLGDIQSNTNYLIEYTKERYKLLADILQNSNNYPTITIKENYDSRSIWFINGESFTIDKLELLKQIYGTDSFILSDNELITENYVFKKDNDYDIFPKYE